jgi:hypothetical protein
MLMQQDELTKYVVTELAKSRNHSNIVLGVCERTNMSWAEAEKFIAQIQYQNRRTIAARKSPFLVIASVVILLAGLGIVCLSVALMAEVRPRPSTFYILGFGFSLVVGGLVGLWKTVAAFF